MSDWNFPKTSRTVMEEALTKSTGFQRDQFTNKPVVIEPFRRIAVVESKSIPYHFKIIPIIGLLAIGYLIARKRK